MREEEERHPRDQESAGDEGEDKPSGGEVAAEAGSEGSDAEDEAMESEQGQ